MQRMLILFNSEQAALSYEPALVEAKQNLQKLESQEGDYAECLV